MSQSENAAYCGAVRRGLEPFKTPIGVPLLKPPNDKHRSKKQHFFGKNPTRNLQIAQASKALQLDPENSALVQDLADAVCVALERDPSARNRIASKSLGKRAAALLRTYAPTLRATVAADVRERCRERFAAIQARDQTRSAHAVVTAQKAATSLGVTVADLHRLLRDANARRALGWPRPIADHLLFAAAVFDPSTAEAYLKQLPETEPWPRNTWPKDWR